MTILGIAVLIAALALIAFLLWFFFGPRTGKAAAIRAGVQEATIRVEGAYQPNVVTVQAGLPVRLRFDRREATDCSNRVVLPDFAISRRSPPSPPPSISVVLNALRLRGFRMPQSVAERAERTGISEKRRRL